MRRQAVTIRTLPNGMVPFQQIRDTEVRKVVMTLNENIRSLKKQLEAVQRAVQEMQRK